MVGRIIHFFWPDLEKKEVKKFGLLSFAFFTIIGSYWLLRLLKNTLIYKVAFPESLGWSADHGRLMQPIAKFWSPLIVLTLVIIYSKLVDLVEKHKLFYILCSIYSFIFASITTLLALRHFYGDAFLGKTILASLGWISFFAIESFGSLIAALFWSFTSSITDTEAAKRGYPLIATCAQFGAVIGSLPALYADKFDGIWQIFLLGTLGTLSVVFIIRHFMRVIPKEELVGNQFAAATESKKEGFFKGFFSGFILLLTRPYLVGVLIVSTFYETISQIIEYQMQSNAYVYPEYSSEIGFAKFQGIYGFGINMASFLMALLGTRYLIKQFGLRFCLLFFPVCLGAAFLSLFIFFKTGNPSSAQILWATFGVMLVAKGLGYAINNPSKEIMYIPTSKDAKFKSKGWIDMFGARTAKQGGAAVTNAFKNNIADLMVIGTFISLGLTVIWIIAAIYVGTKNKKLIEQERIIE